MATKIGMLFAMTIAGAEDAEYLALARECVPALLDHYKVCQLPSTADAHAVEIYTAAICKLREEYPPQQGV